MKRIQYFRVQSPDVLVELFVEGFDEYFGKGKNIVFALAQGRDLYGEDIEPVIQFLSEKSLFAQFPQRVVGGRDNPDVQGDIRLPPTRWMARSCRTLRSLTCMDGETVPISSRKMVPAVGEFELADFASNGTGESPFLMPEKFAFYECVGDRPAVNRDQRRFFSACCGSESVSR